MNRKTPPEPPPDPDNRPRPPASRDLPDLAKVRDTVPQPASRPPRKDRSSPAERRGARRTPAPRDSRSKRDRPAPGPRRTHPSPAKPPKPARREERPVEHADELPYPEPPEGFHPWEFTSLSPSEPGPDGLPPLPGEPAPPSARPGPAELRADPAQHRLRLTTRRRRLDATALGQLLLHLPWLLCSALLIGKVSFLFLGPLGWLPLLAWLSTGVLVFHRPTEDLLCRYLLRLRRPSLYDRAKLDPAWQEVTALAGVDGDRYGLWVEESGELNALAAGGHVVAVTRRALDVLNPRQLAAVLAHELSHQQEGHTWAYLLGRWYGLPARKLWDLLRLLLVTLWHSARSWRRDDDLDHGTYDRYERYERYDRQRGPGHRPHRRDRYDEGYRYRRGSRPGTAAAVALAGLALCAWFFTTATYGLPLAMLAAPFLIGAAARRAEFRADRYAARLGYGRPLADVLEAALGDERERPREPAPLVTRLLAEHPDTTDRLHRLRAHLTAP
ncbi:M48 family metalloprotease [Streptomyces sp. NPDC004111]|uniref:M48 family metalloprotease n=1 Tax=Streptomyces sp. NPDC004111 TaxID=3364690 RepID=UPI00368AA192